jgi:PAS domain S-box-containing protein
MTGEPSQRGAAPRPSPREQQPAESLGEDLVRLLSSALEQSRNLVVISDVNGRVIYVNPRFTEITGYASEDVVGRHARTLREQTPEEEAAVWTSILEREEWSGEVENRKKDGQSYWVNVHVSPVRDDKGNVTHFVGVGEDITDRRRAEADGHRLATILEATPTFVGIALPDGRVSYMNRAARAAVGLGNDYDVSQLTISDCHPEWTNRIIQTEAIPEAQRNGVWRGEGAWVDRDGNETLTSMAVHAHRGPDGSVDFLSTVSHDIEERKRAEDALRESEERYRALYEDNPSMYFTVDEAGTVMSVNSYGADQLGYESKELVGRSVLDVFFEDDREAVRQQLQRLLRAPGEPAEWEFRKVRKDGSMLWVREAARAVRDHEGRLMVLVVCEDITDRKEVEDALRASERRYRALLEAIPDMMFRISRDGVFLEYIAAEGLEPLFFDPAEVIGVKVVDVDMPGDLKELALGAVERALKSGLPETFEYVATLGNVSRFYDTMVVRSGADEALVIVRNMTDQRRAQEALLRLREELEERAERRMKAQAPSDLTFRELTVLQLIVKGNSDKEIGTILGIAQRTVNKHVENILSKMGASSRTEAGVRAVREGLVD